MPQKWCSRGQSWDAPATAHSRGWTTRGGAQRVKWGWSEEKRGQVEPALGAAALTRRLITRGNYNSPCLTKCLFPSLLTPDPASVSNVLVGVGEMEEGKQLTRPNVTPPTPTRSLIFGFQHHPKLSEKKSCSLGGRPRLWYGNEPAFHKRGSLPNPKMTNRALESAGDLCEKMEKVRSTSRVIWKVGVG